MPFLASSVQRSTVVIAWLVNGCVIIQEDSHDIHMPFVGSHDQRSADATVTTNFVDLCTMFDEQLNHLCGARASGPFQWRVLIIVEYIHFSATA